MCGIAGYWTEQRAELRLVERMAAAMPHRGPDHQGAWVDEAAGVALGHRRLSDGVGERAILDQFQRRDL
jgi:asparagine synthase (glutamine-hydrolysing)